MKNFKAPYYAVIFVSKRSVGDNGYSLMAEKMQELAKVQKGYLRFESGSGETNISISYWKTLEDISSWKKNEEHTLTQDKGVTECYDSYSIKVCKVEREYSH